jgi:hypothetical protein
MATRAFPARYPGNCSECFCRFEEGEEIGYVGDEIRCGACLGEAVQVADLPPLKICPKCFLTSCDHGRED